MTLASDVHTALVTAGRPMRMREIADSIGVAHTKVSSRITELVRGCVVERQPDGTFTPGKIAPVASVSSEADRLPNHWLACQQLLHGPLIAHELADLLDVEPQRVHTIMRNRVRGGQVAYADGTYSLTDIGREIAQAEG
jgi:predicted transcriptional regulator